MAIFRPKFTQAKISNANRQIFGIEYAHNEFVTPVAHFKFFNPKGEENTEYGEVYIRMTSTFQTILNNPHQETEGIFGQPFDGGIISGLGGLLGSGLEALTKQLLAGAGASASAIASAGQTGKAQIEFLRREMFNNFQQLIYKGPGFRRFNLNFNMRPTSLDEAEAMLNIISFFRIASSPKDTITKADDQFTQQTGVDDEGKPKDETVDGVNSVVIGESNYTFGYPDMCKFDLMLFQGGVTEELTTLFSSQLCVIENVAVTYGSQNKMTFFDSKGGNKYFPTDVNFELQLKEAVLITESDAINDMNSYTVI